MQRSRGYLLQTLLQQDLLLELGLFDFPQALHELLQSDILLRELILEDERAFLSGLDSTEQIENLLGDSIFWLDDAGDGGDL
jgi:hypothetical protein